MAIGNSSASGYDFTFRGSTGDDEIIVLNEGGARNVYYNGSFLQTVPTGSSLRIFGEDGNDTLRSDDGDDLLQGGAGDDDLTGGLGNDILNGGLGNDNMKGGFGNDTYRVDTILDSVLEFDGQGTDTVISTLNTYELTANVEDLYLAGAAAFVGDGNFLDNDIFGTNNDNILHGNDGNDTLHGRAGNDQLFGGVGNDTLTAGRGSDSMRGDTGADTFSFNSIFDTSASVNVADRVVDFDSSEMDIIDLLKIDANTNVDGNDAFTFIGNAAFSGAAGELRFAYQADTNNTVISGDVNGDGVRDFCIVLEGNKMLVETDFIL